MHMSSYEICVISSLALLVIASIYIRPVMLKGKSLFGAAAVFALLALLASSVITLENLLMVVKGNGLIEPWSIFLIVFSVAFIAQDAQRSGLFEVLAKKAVHWAGSSRLKLYVSVFLITALVTTITSNDIVILTLTPLVIAIAKKAKLNPIPMLVMQFIVANSFSMLFYTGDPTNLIVASAFQIEFNQFAQMMTAPTLTAGLVVGVLVLYRERQTLFIRMRKLGQKTTYSLDSLFSAVLLVTLLISFIVGSIFGIAVWKVAVVFALFTLVKCCIQKVNIRRLVRSLPWSLTPFVLFFFTIAFLVRESGSGDAMAAWLAMLSQNQQIFSLGVGGALLANVVNNQAATVVLSELVYGAGSATESVKPALAIVVATSIGATLSFHGTLAGILWKDTLKKEGIVLSYGKYLSYAFKITPIALLAALLVLAVI